MTKQQVEDLSIGFDEYGFIPQTLCDEEVVVKGYREAFKEIIKDYETMEIIKEILNACVYRYELTFEPNILLHLSKEFVKRIKEFIENK